MRSFIPFLAPCCSKLPCLLASCAALWLGASLTAQATSVILPDVGANFEGNLQSEHPFAYGSSRLQILIDPRAFGQAQAVIREMQLRRDGFGNQAYPAQTVDPVQVWAGRGAAVPSKMSKTFAANVQGSLTKYFDAKLALPPQPVQMPGPFNIRIPFASPIVHLNAWGSLALDIRADTKSLPVVAYLVDAHYEAIQGGSWRSFGTRGAFSTGDRYSLFGAASDQLLPGGRLEITAMTFQSPYPSLMMLGFSRTQAGPIALPFDLTPLGAPGNLLQVSPDLFVPMQMRPAFVGWWGQSIVPIPADPRLDGLDVYVQSLHAQQSANQLGLVFSEGMQARIRQQRQVLEQSLTAKASNATTGELPNEPGAPVMRFVGTFQ